MIFHTSGKYVHYGNKVNRNGAADRMLLMLFSGTLNQNTNSSSAGTERRHQPGHSQILSYRNLIKFLSLSFKY